MLSCSLGNAWSGIGKNAGSGLSFGRWLGEATTHPRYQQSLYALSPVIIVDGARLKLVNNPVKSGSTVTASDWTLTATDKKDSNNTVSGAGGFNATFVTAGTYELSQTGAKGFYTKKIVCNTITDGVKGPDVDVDNPLVTLDWEEEKVCTFTHVELGNVQSKKTTYPEYGVDFDFVIEDDIGETINFTLDNRDTEFIKAVRPGVLTVTESEEPPDSKWRLTGLSCSDSDSGGTASTVDVSQRIATINLDPGETVICTFTNTQGNRFMIEKLTNPLGAIGSFPFRLEYKKDGSHSDFLLTGGDSKDYELGSGEYTITEDDPTPGFDLTRIECLDTDTGAVFPADLNTRTAILDLALDQNVYCTFTNTQRAKLTVVKNTVGGDGPVAFVTVARLCPILS